jgi:hypothetical protein
LHSSVHANIVAQTQMSAPSDSCEEFKVFTIPQIGFMQVSDVQLPDDVEIG